MEEGVRASKRRADQNQIGMPLLPFHETGKELRVGSIRTELKRANVWQAVTSNTLESEWLWIRQITIPNVPRSSYMPNLNRYEFDELSNP
ncbi:hypothetical protein NC651_005639 [Populus alba x Populus x berolinensis]|nr:hypothetical protein NC651_005639 [Populus alba x Populus x berolinensis]